MKKQNGFTLVELMVALAIMAAVFAGVYMTYFSQQKSYMNQEQVAVMQQNLRAAMTIMERDLRLAGYYDRNNPPATLPGFVAPANRYNFTITMDNNESGFIDAPDETIIYSYSPVNRTISRNGQLLADNIDAFDIVYGSGVSAVLNPAGTAVAAADLGSIVSVQITILARSTQVDREYVNQTTYLNQQGFNFLAPNANPPWDNMRRKSLTLRTHCRNLWYRV